MVVADTKAASPLPDSVTICLLSTVILLKCHCAIALQRAFTAHEGERLQVRVGLNAGEAVW